MAELGATTRIRQCDRTASRVIDGKAVVIVIDSQKLHTLSPVGTVVWELADGRSLGAIAEAITERYEVTGEVALDDVRTFAAELVSLGALDIVGD